jgi:hypothetical protein
MCPNCNDTGKTHGSDYLDCAVLGCNVAVERAELEAWAHHQRMTKHVTTADLDWALYQRGKQAGAPM